MAINQRRLLIAFSAAALVGVLFSAVSTYDFVAHLDRQVHAITCSFIPGLGPADTAGTSGCYAALMSPWSSLLRSSLWGGIPIALLSLSVFGFLLFFGLDLLFRHAEQERDLTRFLLLGSLLPLGTSLFYFILSVAALGSLCKLCVGIYLASLGVTVFAAWLHRRSDPPPVPTTPTMLRRSWPWGRYLFLFGEGVLFVAVPLFIYLSLKPAVAAEVQKCGSLIHPEDRYGTRLKLHPAPGGVPALEVLDPLCPACHAFSHRLGASGLQQRLDLEAVLFPLDKECNWMVDRSLHPGACAVSEAVLCAGEAIPEVLEWAAQNGESLRELGARDSAGVYARIKERFPPLANCVGQPAVKARLNKTLRWIVSNALPVVTPQLFVRGRKICDSDTDLGLEYALATLLDAPAPGKGAKP